jgi:hypothetical protein
MAMLRECYSDARKCRNRLRPRNFALNLFSVAFGR